MPLPPYARVQVQRNGGGVEAPGLVPVAADDVITLSPESTIGVTQWRWELTDYPPGFTLPAGWSQDPVTGIVYLEGSPNPPVFSIPAQGAQNWGKFPVRLRVNGNPTQYDHAGAVNVGYVPAMTDEATILVFPDPNGVEGLAVGEGTQGDTPGALQRSWVGAIMRSLRSVGGGGGGGGGGGAGAVILDGLGPPANLRANRAANNSPIDNTKVGIVNLGSDSGYTAGATGNYALILGGNNCVASADNAIAGGSGCNATAISAVAIGLNSVAVAEGAVALGEGSQANNIHAFAFGGGIANGVGSIANHSSSTNGPLSVALGEACVADGEAAAAFNTETNATAANTFATGYQSKALTEGQQVHSSIGSAYQHGGLCYGGQYTGGTPATVVMKDYAGNEWTPPTPANRSHYRITVRVVAGYSGAPEGMTWAFSVAATKLASGVLTVASVVQTDAYGTATFSFVITAVSGTLHMVWGAAETGGLCNIAAELDWVETTF